MEQIPNSQLTQYVLQARASGMSETEIRQELIEGGWPELEVLAALEYPNSPAQPVVSQLPVIQAHAQLKSLKKWLFLGPILLLLLSSGLTDRNAM